MCMCTYIIFASCSCLPCVIWMPRPCFAPVMARAVVAAVAALTLTPPRVKVRVRTLNPTTDDTPTESRTHAHIEP